MRPNTILAAMPTDVLLGLLLGVALGAGNALASVLLYRRARVRSAAAFNKIVLGGMVVRLAAVVVLVALAVWLAPIDLFAFLAALLSAYVLGLAVEITYAVLRPAIDGG